MNAIIIQCLLQFFCNKNNIKNYKITFKLYKRAIILMDTKLFITNIPLVTHKVLIKIKTTIS